MNHELNKERRFMDKCNSSKPIGVCGCVDMSVEESLDRFQVLRRERIKLFRDKLMRGKEVYLRSFLASMSIYYGIRTQTGREYLKDLEAIGEIEIKNGRIKWIESISLNT